MRDGLRVAQLSDSRTYSLVTSDFPGSSSGASDLQKWAICSVCEAGESDRQKLKDTASPFLYCHVNQEWFPKKTEIIKQIPVVRLIKVINILWDKCAPVTGKAEEVVMDHSNRCFLVRHEAYHHWSRRSVDSKQFN